MRVKEDFLFIDNNAHKPNMQHTDNTAYTISHLIGRHNLHKIMHNVKHCKNKFCTIHIIIR